ncbi:glycosyltransferase family 25 protein [Ruegeria lacuscaerulensis]|uniref:glycosyltransferase family 25 protein n=1 Tax=Ruegeria lacuscaerulensis TaxID=55218 RepID=UPI00147FBA13
MSIRTFILSLPKDVERRRFCERELTQHGLHHEFCDAISGDQMAEADLRCVYDADMNRVKFKRPLSRGEVACTLGHRKIWQTIAESNQCVSLVLEDDATFIVDPQPFLNALEDCPECFEDVMIKLDGVPGNNLQVLTSFADQHLVLSDRLPPRTTGYVLGRRAAQRLLKPEAPISRPIDIDLKFYWEHNVPILTLRKQMITERQNSESNIDPCRRRAKPGSPLNRFVRNLVYQAKYTHGRLSHPLNPDMIEGLAPLMRADSQVQKHA